MRRCIPLLSDRFFDRHWLWWHARPERGQRSLSQRLFSGERCRSYEAERQVLDRWLSLHGWLSVVSDLSLRINSHMNSDGFPKHFSVLLCNAAFGIITHLSGVILSGLLNSMNTISNLVVDALAQSKSLSKYRSTKNWLSALSWAAHAVGTGCWGTRWCK